MKKIISIILCVATIFSLTSCMPKKQKDLKKQYENDAIPIAIEYIENKYGFTPEIIDSYGMTKYDGTFYTNATKNIRVKMEHNRKEFITLVAGEEDSSCYDSYEKDLIINDLKEYFKERLKSDFSMDIAYGYFSDNELFKNEPVIQQKYNNDIWSILETDEEEMKTHILIKIFDTNSNLKNLTEEDFKELINGKEKNLNLHIVNLKDKKYIDKFNDNKYLYENYSREPSIGLYATELIEYDEEFYYEKYTTKQVDDFIIVYSNNATVSVDKDFSVNDLSEQVRKKLYSDRHIDSPKFSINFDGTSKKNRLYVYYKVPKQPKNKPKEYSCFFNFVYNQEHLIEFDGEYVDGYAADVLFTKENNIDFFRSKIYYDQND